MALYPIGAFDVRIQSGKQLLIESWWVVQLGVLDVRHLNRSVRRVHIGNSNIYLINVNINYINQTHIIFIPHFFLYKNYNWSQFIFIGFLTITESNIMATLANTNRLTAVSPILIAVLGASSSVLWSTEKWTSTGMEITYIMNLVLWLQVCKASSSLNALFFDFSFMMVLSSPMKNLRNPILILYY